ncbi:MAG: hypothetical protein ACRD38_02295 [Nitrososphaerales archaeon]
MATATTIVILITILVIGTLTTVPFSSGIHKPDKPFITVTGKIQSKDQISYKFAKEPDVPFDYKNDAKNALQSWINLLNTVEPDGDWTFVKGTVSGVTDIVVKLVYDETGNSFFCTNNNDIDEQSEDTGNFIQSAYAEEPRDAQRRSSVWVIYVGCSNQMFSHSNIQRQVAHVIGHGLGLGSAYDNAHSIMCHYKQSNCTVSTEPTEIDGMCIVRLYGSQGFPGNNVHIRPEFCP